MNKRFTKLIAALALLVGLTIPLGMWGQTTVTYTQSSTTAVSVTDGTAPTGSSASFTTTYSNMNQLTAGNSMTLTLYGYQGKKITGITLSMKSNSSKGAGTLSVTAGSTTIASISPAANFNTSSWYGAWSTTYVDVNIAMSNTNYTIQANEDVVITISATVNSLYCESFTFTYEDSTAPILDPCDLTLIDAPVELEFDLYNNSNAQTISYTTSSTGEVSVAQNDYINATVDQQNKTITVIPVAVTNGAKTIRVNQAPDENYASGFVEFTVDIEDSTPFSGGDVTFDAGTDMGSTTTTGPDSMTKQVVTISSTNAAFGYSDNYRMYKNSVTTVSTSSGVITSIAFTQSGNYSISYLTPDCGTLSDGTWTGSASSIVFTNDGTDQTRATKIVVTVNMSGTPDPVITANNVSIEFGATEGEITYTIANPVDGASLGAVVAEGATITNLTFSTPGAESVSFTCDANNTTTARTATVTLNYVKNGETLATKDVTITQTGAPAFINTIPAMFAAATETETEVYVTFNNWVVSGVSTNGKNIFVTDNEGNGFVIYYNGDMSETYSVGDMLSGENVFCMLKLYNGFAELLNVDATDLTIATGGNVTEANVAMSDLAGVNTGALVHYDNLTCSVNNNKYYLTDGTTALQVYNTLFAFEALEAGKTYNITGVYQQYNDTKEILPRSAEDIVEVVVTEPSITVSPNEITVDAEFHQDVLTVTYENLDPTLSNPVAIFYDAEGHETNCSWLMVELMTDRNFRYTISENYGETRTAYFKIRCNGVYSEMVTVSQAAYVAPVTGDKYVKVASTDDLTDGQYLIVYEAGSLAFDGGLETLDAAGNSIPVTISENEIAVTDATAAAEFTIDMTLGTIKSASGYYIGQTTDANGMKASETEAYTNTISIDEDGNATVVASGGAYLRYNATSGQDRFRYFKSSTYSAQKAIQLYKKAETTPTGPTITVNGYGDTDGGYVLIASPTVEYADPMTIGMATGNYDLYYFDAEQELEWRNYKAQDGGNYNLEPGKGYLYANQETVTITFTGDMNPSFSDVELPYTENDVIKSLYLAGNSSTQAQTFYVNDGNFDHQTFNYLTINEDGNGFISAQATSYTAPAMTGFFVQAPGEGMALSTYDINAKANVSLLNINVLRDRGSIIDNAIVSFSNGSMMDKFYLKNNTTRVYIPQGNREMAIANSAAQGEMPVSFRAAENGTYTLSIETENVEMDYLHLIDNLTGMDVDLLQTPSYSFEAKTTDYASRFRLVFSANSTNEQNAETFAFFNGSEWMVSNLGEATLQVVDVMGRVLSTETISGNAELSLNQPAGVYMLRLINGNDVKVQKVVVR